MAAKLLSGQQIFSPEAPRELILAVRINGQPVSEYTSILENAAGRYYAAAEVFRAGRIKQPAVASVRWLDREYYALDAVSGLSCRLDREGQVLHLAVPASAFVDSVFDGSELVRSTAETPEPGLFLNHDFQFLQLPDRKSLSGLVEGGFFSKFGVLTSRFVSRDLIQTRQSTRLDTQFTRDLPHRMATLTLGDSISAAAPGARQVYYGGIRWASKFSTQPGFLPMPLPSLNGEAVQPSVIDVYVDNVRQMSRRVESGPFSIRNVPVLAGQGEIRMVVTDLLGRQQVVAQSYLRSSELLRRGVSEYVYEAGSLRQNYGRTSFDYSSFFAAGTHRYGVTNMFTVSGRGELLPDRQTAGGGAALGIRHFGLLGAGVTGSSSGGRTGYMAYGHLQRISRALGFSGRIQIASPAFRQLGMLREEQAARQLLQAEVSHAVRNRGSVAVGFLKRDGRSEPNLRAATFSASVRLGRAFLTLSTNYSLLGDRHYGASLTLLVPLGNRRMAISTTDVQRETKTSSLQMEQHLPLNSGYGYRVRANTLNSGNLEAGVSYQNQRGTYSVDMSQANGQHNWRISERGSLVLLHGHVLPSRWLNDSFAIVRIPDRPGVGVLVNNQPTARTGRRGTALIPWLVPYDRNSVQLDGAGLPLDMDVDLARKTVIPMPRSGVFLEFAAKRVNGAVVQLVLEDGSPVPLGAQVKLNEDAANHQVAFRGEVFFPEMQYPAKLAVRWEGRACSAQVPASRALIPLPRIGPVVCLYRKQ